MGTHYPLNGLDLDFSRYAHLPVEGRDIAINHIMDDFIYHRRIPLAVYEQTFADNHTSYGIVKSRDRELGLDWQVMLRLCCLVPPGAGYSLQNMVFDLVQLHYFQRDPLNRQVLKSRRPHGMNRRGQLHWKQDMIEHLTFLQNKAFSVSHRYFLFSGRSHLACDEGPAGGKLPFGPSFTAFQSVIPKFMLPPCQHLHSNDGNFALLVEFKDVQHKTPSRSQSVPDSETWIMASLRGPNMSIPVTMWFAPCIPFSELDRRVRRRSLSRSHIRDMFVDKPEWIIPADKSSQKGGKPNKPCANCAQYGHNVSKCLTPCGYCYSNQHKAPECPMKPENRCKCGPFPQFHRATICQILCSRRCGSPYPVGHFKHRRAMLCTHRCCMCGVRGHSGKQCALKKCRCGGEHLTQDCRWKVECAVKDCQFYLCHVHCRECGAKRQKGAENAFVGRTCQDCLKNGVSASGRAAS